MKRNLKRIIAVFLAVVMSLASAAVVFAGDAPEYDEVIAIIHTNDVHGEIEVEPYVKGLKTEMENSEKYSLVLTASAGDVYSGGEAVAGNYKGELIPAIMDQVYDVIAPGNNDFNDGTSHNLLLTALYKKAKTICANLVFKDGIDLPAYASTYKAVIGNADFAALYDGVELNEGALDFSALDLKATAAGTSPYNATEIFETVKGTQLGLFGLSCTGGQMTGKLVGPGSIEAAQNAVAALKTQSADVIVGLAHTGWMGEGSETLAQANDTNAWLLASAVQDMDALIDSHTHVTINDGAGCYVGDNKVLVNQAGGHDSTSGVCIGVMKFYLKNHQVVAKTAELLSGDQIKAITPDATVQAMVNADLERAKKDAEADTTLVTTPYYLNADSTQTSTCRGAETNMGDFITDVILKAASEKREKSYDFSFYPGYCLRKSIAAETKMTQQDISTIISFPVPLVEQEYSAQDIVDLVTRTLQQVYPKNFKASTFFQYSGLKITYAYHDGIGIPLTIKAGDTLIYDALNGGIQVDASWKAVAVRGIDPNEHVDISTIDPDKVICADVNAVRQLICGYLGTHTLGTDFEIYPNELAPDKRIVAATDEISDLDKAMAAISAIGPVTLEKEFAIKDARIVFDALSEGDENEISPSYPITLLSAEVKLGQLKADKAEKDAAAKELSDAKEAAAAVVATVTADDYIETDQATVTKAVEDAQAAIEAAASKEQVAAAIAALNEALAGCKTKRADAREKAAELAKAKKAAAAEINDYVEKNIAKIADADKVIVELAALQNILMINDLENLESIHLGVDAVKALVDQKIAEAYKVTKLKATSKKQKFTVTWKKNAKAEAYQVQYKQKGAKKFVTLKNNFKGTKVTTKKLKKGKSYIFQVRTIKTVNGKKVYGKWTQTKAVKCK